MRGPFGFAVTELAGNAASRCVSHAALLVLTPGFGFIFARVRLSPDRIKFDIEIDNFPFTAAGDSYLGLIVNIQSVAARVVRVQETLWSLRAG